MKFWFRNTTELKKKSFKSIDSVNGNESFIESRHTSVMEGNNLDAASQLTIDQSVQSGISTPKPDSGFVDKDEKEVNWFSTFLKKFPYFQ